MQSDFEILRVFQLVCELLQNFRHRRVDGGVGVGNGRGRTEHTELELIAREGKRRGAVSIRRVLGELRHGMYADAEKLLLLHIVRHILFNGFQKKTQKTPSGEIEKAERLMKEYFESKESKD